MGLVPGTNRGTVGNLGPRAKPGDDGFRHESAIYDGTIGMTRLNYPLKFSFNPGVGHCITPKRPLSDSVM